MIFSENRQIADSLSPAPAVAIFQATSKNYFLRFWARDFVLTKVLEIPEYFVYCGIFKTHCEGKRSVQNPKGQFLEVPSRPSHKNKEAGYDKAILD